LIELESSNTINLKDQSKITQIKYWNQLTK